MNLRGCYWHSNGKKEGDSSETPATKPWLQTTDIYLLPGLKEKNKATDIYDMSLLLKKIRSY